MRRWNGWGDETVTLDVPQSAVEFIQSKLGKGSLVHDVSMQEAVAMVPPSRLPDHALLNKDTFGRLRHSIGESLPDMIAVRGGTIPGYVDAVAYPTTDGEVRQVLGLAKDTGAAVIPYGGGTSVVGHLDPSGLDRPVISLDMGRHSAMLEFDGKGCLATFGAGIAGPDIEANLRAKGFTLGHYPQSWELSTMGGWVASRSSGQFSLGYGRIESLFVGGVMETPLGRLEMLPHPASAAGPSVKEAVLGSEGRMGVITRCTVKISPLPEVEEFYGAFFPDQDRAMAAVREMAQAGLNLTMMRLSLPRETETSLNLSGGGQNIEILKKYLEWRGVRQDMCMLLYGICGSKVRAHWTIKAAKAVIRRHAGVGVGQTPGRKWHKDRFRLPYVRNNLWDLGYAADTLETAVPWKDVTRTVGAVEKALRTGLEHLGEKVHVFTHLSHIYPNGSSIYTSYVFRLGADPAETLERWRILKTAASQALVECKGTISHQHGVGLDHKPYLPAEKGPLGMDVIKAQCRAVDPEGMMNPGKLFD